MQSKNLGELEQEIMNIIWGGNQYSVRDVLGELKKKRIIAYTTVATILHRLYAKGFLLRSKKNLKYIFLPKFSKKDYGNNLVRDFIRTITTSFGDIALTSFAENIEKLPKKKREHLLQLLREFEKK